MKAGEVVADRYRLDARLGIGGMGEVWKATHQTTRREYAIKLLHAHAATSLTARERFTREARVSAKINHPNVIDIFDAGEHDEGTLFLAMELLDGITLADAFHLSPPLSVQDLLVVIHDTARALSAAHAVGIVHRDIKPANVFLHRARSTGLASPKLLDFGISKFTSANDEHHTKTGAVLGSPRYMSPEQTRSAASVDHRADLWACGVILFEGLTGTWPHEGDSFSSLVVAICTTPPTSIDRMVPDLPESVRSIVRDALKPVNDRIQSAAELADRLAAAARDPALAQWPLARPLHPPAEALRSPFAVRIRPLPPTADEEPPESLRTTQSHRKGELVLPASTPVTMGDTPKPPPPSSSVTMEPDDDDYGSDNLATTPIPAHLVLEARARIEQLPPSAGSALPRPLPAAGAPPIPAAEGVQQMRESAEPDTNPLHKRPFRPQARTVPLSSGIDMQAELARGGLVPPSAEPPARRVAPTQPFLDPQGGTDPLVGTLDTLATTTLRDQPTTPAPPSAPVEHASGALPRTRAEEQAVGLRVLAAVLSLLLVVIIIALVAVLRSTPKTLDKPPAAQRGAMIEAPPVGPPTEPAPPASTVPAPGLPNATASASPASPSGKPRSGAARPPAPGASKLK
jgi:serine/threonine-protein kinase